MLGVIRLLSLLLSLSVRVWLIRRRSVRGLSLSMRSSLRVAHDWVAGVSVARFGEGAVFRVGALGACGWVCVVCTVVCLVCT